MSKQECIQTVLISKHTEKEEGGISKTLNIFQFHFPLKNT